MINYLGHELCEFRFITGYDTKYNIKYICNKCGIIYYNNHGRYDVSNLNSVKNYNYYNTHLTCSESIIKQIIE